MGSPLTASALGAGSNASPGAVGKTSPKTKASTGETDAAPGRAQSGNVRETIESIAFAFILAFLFRTFIAEAFVIPTGSMAPTLLGRNKDVICQGCQLRFTIGASDEVESKDGTLRMRISQAICPNCRFHNDVKDLPVFPGDRILVNKFPFEVSSPQRWDVVVFKYPEEPQTNYIKRLVGLPGESILVKRGDVYARKGSEGAFEILRKEDPGKQRVLQQLAYHDSFPPRALLEKGWPERFSAMKRDKGVGQIDGWSPDAEGFSTDSAARTYAVKSNDEWKWLRYQHFIPSILDWETALDDRPLTQAFRPQLIVDFCGYNNFWPMSYGQLDADGYWVGDLTINGEARVDSVSSGAAIVLELVQGIRRYRCEIALETGVATLQRTDELQGGSQFVEMAKGQTAMKGTGTFSFSFANVDQRLCLWINNTLIAFDQPTTYSPPAVADPNEGDLVPVGIAARNAAVTIGKLKLERDIYYQADRSSSDRDSQGRPVASEEVSKGNLRFLHERLSDPAGWSLIYRQSTPAEFAPLGDDEYFMMGDNSPRSMDSRLWSNARLAANRHAVPRAAIIGKAFYIYWPHGIPFGNSGRGYTIPGLDRLFMHRLIKDPPRDLENYPESTIPFYPQFGRWSRIR